MEISPTVCHIPTEMFLNYDQLMLLADTNTELPGQSHNFFKEKQTVLGYFLTSPFESPSPCFNADVVGEVRGIKATSNEATSNGQLTDSQILITSQHSCMRVC